MVRKSIIVLAASLTLATTLADNGVTWIDGTKLPTEGRPFAETIGGPYGRVPLSYAKRVTAADYMHGQDSCGVTFRFKTDSRKLRLRWTLANAKRFVSDRYMTQKAMGGIDVYVETPEGCRLHNDFPSLCGPDITKPDALTEFEMNWTPGDTAIVYLPMRGIVKSFSLGIDEGAKIEKSPHRRQPQPKPVVVYGSSIMHGGCQSRPGLAIPAWTSRLLDIEFVNFGFAGSGKMELAMSDMIAEVDASAYVLRCGNYTLQELKERCEPFLRNLKKRRPQTPILFTDTSCYYTDSIREKSVFQRSVYEKLKAEDPAYWSTLHYFESKQWGLNDDWDLTLERTHPNDAGAYVMSRALAKKVAELIGIDRAPSTVAVGEQYPILSWTFMKAEEQRPPEVVVKEWKDLGFTYAMSPYLGLDSKEHDRIHRMLDLCQENGIKLIVKDARAGWTSAQYVLKDEAAYRKNLELAKREFASHPACAGFFLLDEPGGDMIKATCRAARVMKEVMPDKMCFLNLLPWYSWIGPRMGAKEYAPYLDRVAEESGLDMMCYDFYDQLAEDGRAEGVGFDDYFNNLREWREFTQRNPGRSFWYTPLSLDSATRVVRSQADFRWQISTAAAMGAKGLIWYYVDHSAYHGMGNGGNAPINWFGERTEYFNWLSEENRKFQQQFGSEFLRLKAEDVRMAGFDKPRGGVKPFEGDADILSVTGTHAAVLVSFFSDAQGGRYVALVNLSKQKTNLVTIGLADGVRPKRRSRFNEYKPLGFVADPALARRVGKQSANRWSDYLAAGQLVLLKLR